MIEISVIIPVRNNMPGLKTCIKALENQTIEKELFEVVVVFNQKLIPENLPKPDLNICFINEKNNISSYAARNYGLKKSKGNILAFTDSDCIPDKNWLLYGYDRLKNTNNELVAGNVLFTFSKKQSVSEVIDSCIHMKQKVKVKEQKTAATANLFIKKEILKKLNGFPHVPSGGDTIFSMLANNAGYKISYANNVIIKHPARKFKSLIKKRYRIGKGLPLITYFKKNKKLSKTIISLLIATLKDFIPPRKLIVKKNFGFNFVSYFVIWACNLMTAFGRLYGLFMLKSFKRMV